MIHDTFNAFSKAVEFIGLEKTEQQILSAIKNSDFSILSKQETENGFKEKMIKSKSFFRKGEIGDWQNHLSTDIVNFVLEEHKDIMKTFGYLNSNNKLIF